MRARLKAAPAEEIVKYLIAPRLFGDIDDEFRAMSRINTAHVVMLIEEDILSADVGARLLQSLAKIAEGGPKGIPLDPAKEDLYFNVEAAVIAELGSDVGGQIHTGRSRNDLYATIQRMKVREQAISVTRAALGLERRLLDLAEQHLETVMTGYTHMQPGQPITVGHYLSGVAEAFRRDTARLLAAYAAINLSPLGAGGLATTGFPINRYRTLELLGFDGLVENSLDAVGSRDYIADLLYAFSMMAITVSRFCHDLHVWYTAEYAYIDIDDSIAGTSSIMPQKKNPSPIEHLKAKAAHHIGALMSTLACLKGTPFTHGREVSNESVAPFKDALYQIEAVLALADVIARGLRFRVDNLRAHAERNYCTLTELADTLVRHHGVSFRVAHEIVGSLAKEAHDRALTGTRDISSAFVNEVALRITGRNLGLTDEELFDALDPRRNVERRSVPGGPAPVSVRRMIETGRQELDRRQATLEARVAALAAADQRLRDASARLFGRKAGQA